MTPKEIPYGYCHCGCGQLAKIAKYDNTQWGWVKGEPRKYVKGHNSRTGDGRKHIAKDGYVYIRNQQHKRTNNSGYMLEHILVMEKYLKRKVLLTEAIHHIDGDKSNNSIGNLMLFKTHGMHHAYEARLRRFKECGRWDLKICCICHKYDYPANMTNTTHSRSWHKKCKAEHEKNRKLRNLQRNQDATNP